MFQYRFRLVVWDRAISTMQVTSLFGGCFFSLEGIPYATPPEKLVVGSTGNGEVSRSSSAIRWGLYVGLSF